MAISYRVLYSSNALTEDELNVQGDADYLLIEVISVDVGHYYVFRNPAS